MIDSLIEKFEKVAQELRDYSRNCNKMCQSCVMPFSCVSQAKELEQAVLLMKELKDIKENQSDLITAERQQAANLAIQEFSKKLLKQKVIDKSVIRRITEQSII